MHHMSEPQNIYQTKDIMEKLNITKKKLSKCLARLKRAGAIKSYKKISCSTIEIILRHKGDKECLQTMKEQT